MNTGFLWVIAGGALGSLCRFWVGLKIPFNPLKFPWATFSVNLIGALVIGTLFFLRKSTPSYYFWIPGFLGGFTTFSGFAWEAVKMWEQGQTKNGILYVTGSVLFGLILAWIGYQMMKNFSK